MNRNSTTQGHMLLRLLLALAVATLFTLPAFSAAHIQLSAAGVTFGQSVRFHAVNLTPPPDPDSPPDPCHVQLALVDLSGKPITDERGSPAVQEGDLLPGQSLTLVFNSTGVVRRGERLVVRGQVSLTSDPKLPPPCDQMAPSLEVVNDGSARTQVYVSPGEIAGINPQPDPPGFVRVAFDYPMIGVASGQQASLRLVAVPVPPPPTNNEIPPGPCHATLAFYDLNGQVLTNKRGIPFTKEVDLEPGGSAEFTVNSDNVKLADGRVLVRAQVSSPTTNGFPPGPCLAFTSGLEIVNSSSVHSVHFVGPAEIHGFNPQPDPPGVPSN